jgi:two-component system KDP operon response regulator KdpE
LKPDPTALIIDSDKAVTRLLRILLEPCGYLVFDAATGQAGLKTASDCKADVIILELTLPDDNGLIVLQGLREWTHAPVLVLSEKTDDQTKVAALDAGANDYLSKPFSGLELLARLRVLQRPLPYAPDGPFIIEGDLVANFATHEITLRGRPLTLTPKEEALFYILARYSGKVVARTHLLRAIWGIYSEERTHDLQVLICNLRKKLGHYGGESLIKTEGSLGYRFLLSAQPEPVTDSAGL